MSGSPVRVTANVTPRLVSHHSIRCITQRRASAIGYGEGTWIRYCATRQSPAPAATEPASLARSSRSTRRWVASSGGRTAVGIDARGARVAGRVTCESRRDHAARRMFGAKSPVGNHQKMPGHRPHVYDLPALALVALGLASAAVATVQDVSTHHFENGLTLHVASGHPAPVAALQAWVGVGSADEAAHQAGVAHVI